MSDEVKNVAINAGIFGAIGYGTIELVRWGTAALVRAPDFFHHVASLNPLHFSGVCALFVVVDAVARSIIKEHTRAHDIARIAGSVVVTSIVAKAIGLTACAFTTGGAIVIALGVYALVLRLLGVIDRDTCADCWRTPATKC